jgi:(R,R)-butanediol dehydrogenase/meso-butanediol dehydrogenase/diacetyl reductase
VDPNFRCGICSWCREGKSNLCVSSDANLFSGRGLGRYVDVHHSYLRPLPELAAPFRGALAEPLSCALHALDLAALRDGDTVLILGCGSLGTMLAFALSRLHPGIPTAVYDPVKARARKLAEVFAPQIQTLTRPPGHPAYSLVFEASGKALGFRYSTQAAAKGGRVVILSRYHDRRTVYLPADFPRRQGMVLFSHLNGHGEAFTQAIAMIASGWEARHDALLHVAPMAYATQVFAALDRSPFNKTILRID